MEIHFQDFKLGERPIGFGEDDTLDFTLGVVLIGAKIGARFQNRTPFKIRKSLDNPSLYWKFAIRFLSIQTPLEEETVSISKKDDTHCGL